MQLNQLKDEIDEHCTGFIDKTDEKHTHKRNVLMATLEYFEDHDQEKLNKVIEQNPRYAEGSSLWGSYTLACVTDGRTIVEKSRRINLFKETMPAVRGSSSRDENISESTNIPKEIS